MNRPSILVLSIAFHMTIASAQRPVSFPLSNESAAQIQADLYGTGSRAVILAHGVRFNKESWKKQADVLAKSGFLVLAIRFRGDTIHPDGSPSAEGSDADNAADVLAAVSYLRKIGVKSISAVGASLGGDAVGEANVKSAQGTFACIVFLASAGGDEPEKLNGRKLFILARDDRNSDGLRLPGITANYTKAPQPKKLVTLEGSAHAQFLFDTNQGPRLLDEILRFLTAP